MLFRNWFVLSLLAVLCNLPEGLSQTDTLCLDDLVRPYHVIGQEGSTFFWETGGNGTIDSGQGNDSVIVRWNSGNGPYELRVTETNAEGCQGDPRSLNILF
jgi:hypothetical protein